MDVRCNNCFKIFNGEYMRCPYCGYSDGEPPKELYHLYPGTELLGRYIIGEVLGFGGFGITYKAWDKKFETILAIKEYYPCGIVNRVPGTSEVILFTGKKKDIFNNGLERFLDEAKNMAKFSQNNNIVNVFEYFEDNNTGYIVMELLEGISLSGYLLKQTQKLPLDEIMTITLSVCSALKELHAIGIIHRDISPDNIYMCSNGKIKLIDFGAARFSLNEEKKMTIILKPGFAPPEQYEKVNKQGPWTDIYALGATLYLLLTGTKPDESTNRKVNDTVIPPNKIDPAIPDYISNTVMKAIALDKKHRFNTIEKFEKALLKKNKVSNINDDNYSTTKKSKSSVVFNIAIFAIIIFGIVFSAFKLLNNHRAKLKAADISLSYLYYSEKDKSVKDTAMKEIVKSFNKEYPQIKISMEAFDKNTYIDKLKNLVNSGSEPNIYDSTYLDASELTSNAMSTQEIFNTLDKKVCMFYSDIARNSSLKNKIPLGFNVPVIFIRKTELNIESHQINSLSSIGDADSLEDNICIDGKNENIYKSLFSDDEVFSETYVVDNTSEFYNGNIPYYFTTTEDYENVQKNMAGMYEMVCINKDKIMPQYTECYSIKNKGASDAQKKASIEFLNYMYSDIGQETMYIRYWKKAIPINKNSFSYYKDVNLELRTIFNEISELK